MTPFRSALLQSLFFGLLAALGGLGASCRVEVSSEGTTLRLVNLFLSHDIPASSIVAMDASAGLLICTTAGEKVGSTAYGDSLIGGLLGYRRAARLVDRLRHEVQTREAASLVDEGPSPSRRLRSACSPLPLLAWSLAYLLVALLASLAR